MDGRIWAIVRSGRHQRIASGRAGRFALREPEEGDHQKNRVIGKDVGAHEQRGGGEDPGLCRRFCRQIARRARRAGRSGRDQQMDRRRQARAGACLPQRRIDARHLVPADQAVAADVHVQRHLREPRLRRGHAEDGGSDGQKAEGGDGRAGNRPPLPRSEKGDGQEQSKLRLDDEAAEQQAGGEGPALQEQHSRR